MKKIMFMLLIISCASPVHNKHEAEKQFAIYANSLGIEYDHVICNTFDSDRDGYIPCTYSVNNDLHQIECAGVYNFQQGCRLPKISFTGK